VLCFAGLRRAECLALKLDDVNLAKSCIIVRQGKGQKSRTVYPYAACMEALREWLALRPQANHDYLFPFDKKRRICNQGLARLLEDIKAIAGLADHDNVKPHSLRHNCATRLLRNGADMRTIQAFLGHSHLSTTSIYLHTDETRLREVASLGGLEPKKKAVGVKAHEGEPTKRTRLVRSMRKR
jgi:site-specific recombinase XerD